MSDPAAPILMPPPTWQSPCGRASLYLGDCRDLGAAGWSADALVSDPPYGMGWNTNATRFSGGSRGHRRLGQGRDDWGDIAGDDGPFDPSPWLAFPRVVLFGFNHFAASLPVGTTLVWIKRNDGAFGTFLSDAELAWMKGGRGVYCRRDLSMQAETRRKSHPSQKPVPLMQWCLDRAKVPLGGLVLDPYAGGGSTGVACIATGRRFVGVERESRYFDAARDRLAAAAAEMPLFPPEES